MGTYGQSASAWLLLLVGSSHPQEGPLTHSSPLGSIYHLYGASQGPGLDSMDTSWTWSLPSGFPQLEHYILPPGKVAISAGPVQWCEGALWELLVRSGG